MEFSKIGNTQYRDIANRSWNLGDRRMDVGRNR